MLVVDDDVDTRALYQHALGRAQGFTVVGEAHDGLEGVTAARRCQPDVVLLDVMMPVMDGLVALPLIKSASPFSRVVMLSSLPGRMMIDACMAAGAAGFVQKSHALDKTLESVRQILEE